jgi:hypothetical protein
VPRGRHRRAENRRGPLPRVLGAICVTALSLATLGAALPLGAASSDPTAEPALVFGPTESGEGAGETLLDGRDEAAAGRSVVREGTTEPEPTAVEEPETPVAEEALVEEPPTEEPLPEVIGQLWATTAVNVRSGPSVDDERLGTLGWADPVDVTGETADGWTQVIWDERVGWVSSSYLAEEEPVVEEEPDVTDGVSSASCATSPEIEGALAANAAATYRAVCAAFPGVASAYGGYRPGDGGDHGSGHALDIMVSGSAGWEIAAYLQAHADELGISYLIYEQQIWMAGDAAGAWEYMADRGSPTANHEDHVHVSTY